MFFSLLSYYYFSYGYNSKRTAQNWMLNCLIQMTCNNSQMKRTSTKAKLPHKKGKVIQYKHCSRRSVKTEFDYFLSILLSISYPLFLAKNSDAELWKRWSYICRLRHLFGKHPQTLIDNRQWNEVRRARSFERHRSSYVVRASRHCVEPRSGSRVLDFWVYMLEYRSSITSAIVWSTNNTNSWCYICSCMDLKAENIPPIGTYLN